MTVHRLLARQLRRTLGSAEHLPPEVADFVSMVDATYTQADTDRAMLERAVEARADFFAWPRDARSSGREALASFAAQRDSAP